MSRRVTSPSEVFTRLPKYHGPSAVSRNFHPPRPPRSVPRPPRCVRVGCDLVGPRCPSASRVAAGGSGDARSSGCGGCVRRERYNGKAWDSKWVPARDRIQCGVNRAHESGLNSCWTVAGWGGCGRTKRVLAPLVNPCEAGSSPCPEK